MVEVREEGKSVRPSRSNNATLPSTYRDKAEQKLAGTKFASTLVASPHGANLGLARIGCLKLGKTELGFMLGRWPG